MKRLIKKAFGQILFHGTSLEGLKSITSAGVIMPQESEGGGIDENNQREAEQRAFNRLYNEGIRPDTDEWNDIYPRYVEEEYAKEEAKFEGFTFFSNDKRVAYNYCTGNPNVIIEVSLPAKSLMPDDNDCPECVTWEESLKYTDQVKVLGPITEDYINGVYIFDDLGDAENHFYPKFTWVNEYKQK